MKHCDSFIKSSAFKDRTLYLFFLLIIVVLIISHPHFPFHSLPQYFPHETPLSPVPLTPFPLQEKSRLLRGINQTQLNKQK